MLQKRFGSLGGGICSDCHIIFGNQHFQNCWNFHWKTFSTAKTTSRILLFFSKTLIFTEYNMYLNISYYMYTSVSAVISDPFHCSNSYVIWLCCAANTNYIGLVCSAVQLKKQTKKTKKKKKKRKKNTTTTKQQQQKNNNNNNNTRRYLPRHLILLIHDEICTNIAVIVTSDINYKFSAKVLTVLSRKRTFRVREHFSSSW